MEVYEDHNTERVMNADPRGVQCPDSVVRKDEEPVNIDFTISEIQNKSRIIHGRVEIWNLSSSVHIDIERVSAANE